jgi:hypothetical protein
MLEGVQRLLRSNSKHVRIPACNAALIILEMDRGFGCQIVDQLIASLTLDDDGYGENGSANGWVDKVLARIMVDHPQEIDNRIQHALKTADEEVQSALFGAYERVLRPDRWDDDGVIARVDATAAQRIAFGRFIEALTLPVTRPILTKAIWFLRTSATRFPQLLEEHAETLLGAAALISAELDVKDSPISNLEIKPDPLRALQQFSRRTGLNHALNDVVAALGSVAARKPQSVGRSVLQTLEALDDRHDRLKAALLKCIAAMAVDTAALPRLLPAFYDAMTSQSTLDRGAAARAYAAFASRAPDDLPSLVHEGFLLLLADPFVLVHSSALEALGEVSLPGQYTARARELALALAVAYYKSPSDDHVFAQCLTALLDLWWQGGEMPESIRRLAVLGVGRMSPSTGLEFVKQHGEQLRGDKGLPPLLLALLGAPDATEGDVEFLVSKLGELPRGDLLKVAADIPRIAKDCLLRNVDATDHFLLMLTEAGAWDAAVEISRDATALLSDTTWDRPRKLRSSARQLAAEIEAAAASRNTEHMAELSRRWTEIANQIRQDDEAHENRRNPLFGLPLSNPGE